MEANRGGQKGIGICGGLGDWNVGPCSCTCDSVMNSGEEEVGCRPCVFFLSGSLVWKSN